MNKSANKIKKNAIELKATRVTKNFFVDMFNT